MHASGKLLWVMSSKFLGCLSTALLSGSALVENFEKRIKHSLEMTDCYRLDPVSTAPWAELTKLEKTLKY